MGESSLHIVVLGLSISSSWGNGHAATYRGLLSAMNQRGHRVAFLERDVPWYRDNRDLPAPDFCRLEFYADLKDLRRFEQKIARADLVIVGSYIPDGVQVAQWVLEHARHTTAFYDIDTPVTLQKLRAHDFEYLTPSLIPHFDLYLSFTGGPTLEHLEEYYGAPRARPLYCAVDAQAYRPAVETRAESWLLGYLGTYSADRQPGLNTLMLDAARQLNTDDFVVAGPSYPANIDWPENVARIAHIAPPEHPDFYHAQRFTLNITRQAMVQAGFSPSVRLFEAAACATPVISDKWTGIEQFFSPGEEILLAKSTADITNYLRDLSPETARRIGQRARERVLAAHTPHHRVLELERYVQEATSSPHRASVSSNE